MEHHHEHHIHLTASEPTHHEDHIVTPKVYLVIGTCLLILTGGDGGDLLCGPGRL